MNVHLKQVILADDDADDCMLFGDALSELDIDIRLTIVHDGEGLLKLLDTDKVNYPALLFLDVNMPRKNGFECLEEIAGNEKWSELRVVIYSTSLDPVTINTLMGKGASRYIRKPAEFSQLKEVIQEAIITVEQQLI